MARRFPDPSDADTLQTGDSVTGALVRSIDWAATPLGPVTSWPSGLRTTVETLLHSRHPMFLWWGPDLIQFYNDAYLPSFGTGKHPAAMGQPGRECWQEIWPIIGPQIDDVMRDGRSTWNEDHLVPILRNGRIEEVYWTYGYSPVFDDDRTIGGTLVVCTETTSRVLAERRLRLMRTLAESTALAPDTDAVLTRAAETLTSATADVPFALFYRGEGTSRRLVAAIGLDAAAIRGVDPMLRRHLAAAEHGPVGPVFIPPNTIRLPGGAWPEPASDVFVVPVSTAGAPGAIVFGLSPRLPFDEAYRDHLLHLVEHVEVMQTRLQAALARAATESERNNLLLQAPVATALLTGPAHVFEIANPLFCQVVGRQQLVGRSFREAFPELVDTALPGVLDHVFRTGEPFVTNEYLVPLDRRGDGTLEDCFFRFNLEPLRDATGRVRGMMAVAVEITDQVTARQVLERTHAEREKLLADLESAARAKDEFLAMLGHELRNPLSPIVTALQLMRLRGEGRTTREQDVIERQVNHLVRLVDDLLDVSRITRGKVELRLESVEIADVVAKAIEIASFLLEQRRHRLVVDTPDRGLRCQGDPVRLAQVVANLLTNAARYTDVGGTIRIWARHEGEEIALGVKDNGSGIPPEMLPHLFDLFVQGRRTSDRSEGGLGIGLTLVKNLVALHGGTVSAWSDGPGTGSEFVIRLPAGRPTTAASAPDRGPAVTGPSTRVLVVDDNADAAESLAALLRMAGHEVAVAHDPLTALRVAPAFRPAVAILDIGLPVMDGYELATRLRTELGFPCHLIALSGYGQEHDRERSAAAGIQDHLVKPADPAVILRLVAGASAG